MTQHCSIRVTCHQVVVDQVNHWSCKWLPVLNLHLELLIIIYTLTMWVLDCFIFLLIHVTWARLGNNHKQVTIVTVLKYWSIIGLFFSPPRKLLVEACKKLYHPRREINNNINMPAVASVPKELYLCTSLKDLNQKTEIKHEKTNSTKRYLFSKWFGINYTKYISQRHIVNRILIPMQVRLFPYVFSKVFFKVLFPTSQHALPTQKTLNEAGEQTSKEKQLGGARF